MNLYHPYFRFEDIIWNFVFYEIIFLLLLNLLYLYPLSHYYIRFYLEYLKYLLYLFFIFPRIYLYNPFSYFYFQYLTQYSLDHLNQYSLDYLNQYFLDYLNQYSLNHLSQYSFNYLKLFLIWLPICMGL